MVTKSTIMDSNSFKPEDAAALDPVTRKLVERRRILGPSYRLFYRKPLHLVKGQGTHLFDADGVEYLDAYNNVASVGHCHPRVVAAASHQMATLNTHTRYLHEGIIDYAEDLLSFLPDPIDRVMFLCSGSEANDLAVRIAQAYTGGTGILVTSEAYHGNTALITKLSPAIGADQPMAIDMRMIPTPDTYRQDVNGIGQWLADQAAIQIADMKRHGIKFAGLLADSIFSSDGVFPGEAYTGFDIEEGTTGDATTPGGFLKPLIDLVHAEGGVFIADEVQPGFARTGEAFWGFQRHGVQPDIVTMGKPMANGMPCSALAAREEVLNAFALESPYFNTFAGNPVSMAAAQAVLDIIREENIQENVLKVGTMLKSAIAATMSDHPCLGDVRGAGFFIGVEIVRPGTNEPDYQQAVQIIEEMRERHVLASLCGPFGNVVKVRPPLVFSENDCDWFMDVFTDTLDAIG